MPASPSVPISHEEVDLDGVRIHYAAAGDGPPMVFLHGFPQCWYEWRHQLAEFSRDHRVVAPDLRGYNLSSKPARLSEYGVLPAVEDLRALVVDHLGHDRVVLVAHDWGAGVGWAFAIQHPELVDRLVILCTAHPALFDRALHESPEQQEASQYLLAVRQPQAAELLAADDYALMRAQFDFPWMREEDLEVYVESWRQPGALEGMLAWYRREGLGPPSDDGTPARGNFAHHQHSLVVNVPTLVLYPDADAYTRPPSHEGLERYVPDLDFRVVKGGSHWLADEHPDLVNDAVREFVGAAAHA